MDASAFGQWKFSVDADATILAYAQAERGGADTCDCAGCRNFRLARTQVFPAKFLSLLLRLGIDPRKDTEVVDYGPVAPGRHVYEGWYHFVGTLEETGDFPTVKLGDDFQVWMCAAHAPRLPSLEDKPVVQLEFYTEAVPWLLHEPEMP